MQTIILGGGCFWCTESVFSHVKGVIDVTSGYMGGHVENPTYQQVCSDTTGHAEVVQIEFDPAAVSYEQLLEAFLTMHDPTQLNRQGPDIGSQYRSVVFYHSPEQERAATETFKRLQEAKRFSRPIVTELVPEAHFWEAEEYHQKYLERRGLSNCHL